MAILRANGLGDYVFTLPALQAIRDAYPQAEIVLLGLEWHNDFISTRPGPVDRVLVVPGNLGLRRSPSSQDEFKKLENFFSKIQNENFDLAIQMFGGGLYSNPYIKRLGARFTVGLKAPDAEELDRWVPYIYFQPEILRFLEVARLVGAATENLEPHVEIIKADLQESFEIIPENDQPLIALHLGGGDMRRRWSPVNFAHVANVLSTAGNQVVVIGTELEKEAINEMHFHLARPVINLVNRLSLGGLAGLLSRCSLVISNDSGPVHLAGAVGTATIPIYWCGNLVNAGPVTRTLHRPMVSWRLDCPVCGSDIIYHPCDHQVSLVNNVSVDEVLVTAYELLALEQVRDKNNVSQRTL
ncbi:MAG: glycosyltransferase family 9 protein [Omnitrophica WOR_2 bacterium]